MSARRSRCARTPKSTCRSTRPLRCEQLESRTVLSAISPLVNPQLLAASPVAAATAPAATGPTVVRAASAIVNGAGDITGTTAVLSVLASDAQDTWSLEYTWTINSAPAGGAARFTINGSNAAKNDTVVFAEAGVYGITVTIVNKSGLSIASNVNVTVVQTPTHINLYSGPSEVLVNPNTRLDVSGTSETLSAMVADQFGNPLAVQPACTWAATSYSSGGEPSLANSGGTETITFSKAGTYSVSVSDGGSGPQARAWCAARGGRPTAVFRRHADRRRRGSPGHVGPVQRRPAPRPIPKSVCGSDHARLVRRQPAGRGSRPANHCQRLDGHGQVLGGRRLRAHRPADRHERECGS